MGTGIVFLDASTIDYGDIDFSEIREIGELVCHGSTSPDQVAERCAGAEIVITNKVVFSADVLSRCPGIRMIAEAATGYNNIDIAEARRRGITVANVPGYSTASVVQLTMAFILALSTHLVKYNGAAHDGTWSRSGIFTLGTWPFSDLEGKTVGIMGLGAIGKNVARICNAFGMKVIALRRGESAPESPYERVDLYDLARESDIITIHMPLSDYSRRLVDREFLSRMKQSAFLINMARGPIVEPADLCRALEQGTIAGAALDVMELEPPREDDPLLRAPNLIITPHIAWASIESRKRLVHEIAENIRGFLAGEKKNVVTA
ncbi:MAG TPA: D-2-hydroxyacid dehydrogenase [Spirochaetota bacterium]|nr:D-2-hydroxyacid dehydrogenase [Spirochaetota bacterium]HPC40904.1 D-2-hydroxyacid dehydrogenase [Spirochaetota bacterium]HPL16031.1 D-2-hydroxyacid dehydrogenase [Spirochaetota bacterium]HQF08666.1 D-2-hydroxyacid dehydrogenase [Spirochaetota bacterium]HQH97381.1 D-2-hydroxyacid dehydrogenase [Spirochaetota bacterium]